MSPNFVVAATQTVLPFSPNAFVIWGLLTLGTALVVGFAAGVVFSRFMDQRVVAGAERHWLKARDLLVRQLSTACKTSEALEKARQQILSPNEGLPVQKLLERLHGSFGNWIKVPEKTSEKKPEEPPVEPLEAEKIPWTKLPLEATTGIPNRSTFEHNLTTCLQAHSRSRAGCGLLFIKMDRFESLQERHQRSGAQALLKRLVSVATQAGRDQDFICHFSNDTVALMLVNVDDIAGQLLADKVRETIRGYRFMLPETEQEVLVTASFGYTYCPPETPADLAANRAGDALHRSQRVGRNQLHVHDGRSLVAAR